MLEPKTLLPNWDLRTLIRILDKPAMILAIAAALTGLLVNLEFNSLEAQLYDMRMMVGSTQKPNPDIVIVTLDEASAQALGDFAPLGLDQHVRLLETLESYGPKGLGYLVNMNHVNQVNPELFESEWGSRFVDSVRRMERRGIPVIVGTAFDVNGEVLPPYPLSSLDHSIAVIHRDGNVFSGDKVTRRALVELYGRPVFHTALARSLGVLKEGAVPRGTFNVQEADGKFIFFRYHGKRSAQDVFKYKHYSFSDLVERKVDPAALAGKIVLVGSYMRQNPADSTLTPYRDGVNTPSLVVHANILDSILTDSSIVRAPNWFTAFITFLFVLFVVSWVVQAPPLNGLAATVGLAALFLFAGHLLFQGIGSAKGVWIQESTPLMGILLGYYFVVPYRLIREHQKRWDFQRRHEVLVQVEELKTNFLSLITHDLKTPVARIQGLAELVLRNAYDRLVPKEIDAIHTMMHSTDELNRFISSILELTKVESKHFQLRPESKDVNQIIEKSVESFQTLARSKEIALKSELDPLFPVQLDPSLISKVINNLIDNAIKYSPAGSAVEIYSREIEDHIEISVKDQGVGLSDEDRKNLFTRFFRAKNEATQQVRGTGLGLYLTKYFVEAHQGSVEVESSPGKGSTFRIRLPLNLVQARLKKGPSDPKMSPGMGDQKETRYV